MLGYKDIWTIHQISAELLFSFSQKTMLYLTLLIQSITEIIL